MLGVGSALVLNPRGQNGLLPVEEFGQARGPQLVAIPTKTKTLFVRRKNILTLYLWSFA
jgi:hypothetical protein